MNYEPYQHFSQSWAVNTAGIDRSCSLKQMPQTSLILSSNILNIFFKLFRFFFKRALHFLFFEVSMHFLQTFFAFS